ncbi:acyltransferase [Streptomyces sp. PTM05]|uniref:Acyltransferase n=1 Tax=Streptantibioticus parmotrematis TaxID=2873249 RepID=A0ABS7QQ58_9ACTN|nr:acyltransferase [Streptantibioticus parmotrematis]MBY8883934.1 acyltransferase [Streptantibioticus parmotrematis]
MTPAAEGGAEGAIAAGAISAGASGGTDAGAGGGTSAGAGSFGEGRRAAGRRLRALDGLRLIAALAVCAYHYAGRGGDIAHAWGASAHTLFPTLSGPFSYGCLGVQLFFVISGFVICMSGWGRTPRAFAASRAARLLPAYWIAILLITVVFALPWVPFRPVSPSDLLTNLTMLQMPVGAPRVLGVCWTLWAELRFYLLFALFVLWRGAGRRQVLTFCVLWTAAAVMADGSHQPLLKLVLMPEYAPFFVGGMGLYLVHRFGHDAASWSVVAVGWLLGQHYAVSEMVAPRTAHVFHHRGQLTVIALVTLSFAAVAVVTLTPVSRVDWRWLTTAGALTYPFYLVHEHLGWVLIDALRHDLPGRARPPAWAVLLGCAASMLLLAWLLHVLVERPLTPRIRRALLKSAGPPTPALPPAP